MRLLVEDVIGAVVCCAGALRSSQERGFWTVNRDSGALLPEAFRGLLREQPG